jgi:hypothetical protein
VDELRTKHEQETR